MLGFATMTVLALFIVSIIYNFAQSMRVSELEKKLKEQYVRNVDNHWGASDLKIDRTETFFNGLATVDDVLQKNPLVGLEMSNPVFDCTSQREVLLAIQNFLQAISGTVTHRLVGTGPVIKRSEYLAVRQVIIELVDRGLNSDKEEG